MSQVYHFQNFYVTRLREAVDVSSTTIYVDNPPTISSGILVLEGKNASKREIIYFSSVSGYTLNDCVRGLEGTIPNTHNQGATIEQAVTAGQLDQVLSPHILLQGLGNDENAAMSQDAVTRVFTKAHNADGTLKDNSVTTAAIGNGQVTLPKLNFASFPTIKTQQAASTSSQNMEITSPGVVIISGVARKISAGASTGKINVSGSAVVSFKSTSWANDSNGTIMPQTAFVVVKPGTLTYSITTGGTSDNQSVIAMFMPIISATLA